MKGKNDRPTDEELALLSNEELAKLGLERYVTAEKDLYIESGLLPPHESAKAEQEIENYIRETRDNPTSSDVELPEELKQRFRPIKFENDPELQEQIDRARRR